MKKNALSIIGLALVLAASLAPGAQARTESFQSLASSPVALTSVAADPTTGIIYAQENDGTAFFAYDPRLDTWVEKATAPIDSGNNGGATYLNGKIYTSYTEKDGVGVYDIATDSWTTIGSPLAEDTGNILGLDGSLYFVVGQEFARLDPATGVVTQLAAPPAFQVRDGDECDEGFEPWGGLQSDGAGHIYGHQGNDCNGFAVYDIATNSWAQLAPLPEIEEGNGPVLGSAFDPVTNTYLAYGPYGGTTLFRYDIDTGIWTTAALPFDELEDGGMAYVGLPGIEGVYMVEGEEGPKFGRLDEQTQTDVSPTMTSVASSKGKLGEIDYSIQVHNNGPEHGGGIVLSDQLPAGTSLLGAVPSQGTCAAAATLTCSLGGLRSGGVATVLLKLAAPLGQVTNTVAVTTKTTDSNPANNSATLVTTVPACVVPKLRGLKLKAAKKALRKAQCKPGKVKRRFSGKKKKKVLSVGKKRGTVLPVGTKVKLSVSKGQKHRHH